MTGAILKEAGWLESARQSLTDRAPASLQDLSQASYIVTNQLSLKEAKEWIGVCFCFFQHKVNQNLST